MRCDSGASREGFPQLEGGDGEASGAVGVVGTRDSVGKCWRKGRQPGVRFLTGAWEALEKSMGAARGPGGREWEAKEGAGEG